MLSILVFPFSQKYWKRQTIIRRLLGIRARGGNGFILTVATIKL